MALVHQYAWGLDIPQAQYEAAGDTNSSSNVDYSSVFSRQPPSGEGGSEAGFDQTWPSHVTTFHSFTGGALSEGLLVIDFYLDSVTIEDAGYIRLLAADNTVLFQVDFTNETLPAAMDFYSGEGSQTLRGTSATQFNVAGWNQLVIGWKVGATGHYFGVMNGVSETYVADGADVGATSSPAKVSIKGIQKGNAKSMLIAAMHVFDARTDRSSGEVHIYPGGPLRPKAHDTDTNWVNESGAGSGTASLFNSVNSATYNAATYVETTTNDAVILLGVTYSDVFSAEPDAHDKAVIQASVMGTGLSNNVRLVCKSGGTTTYSDDIPVADGVATAVSWPFARPDGGDWDETSFNAAAFGVQNRQL